MPIHEDGGSSPTDGKCPSVQPDMTVTPAKCAAAKGLAGDNLFCVDFSSIADQSLGATPPAKLDRWDFVTNCGGMNWEIAGGKLQLKNFAMFMSSCGFLMPSLTAIEYGKYNSFTLSVVQRVDISETASQKVQVMLGTDDPLTRLLTQWTGKQAHQQSIVVTNKGDLPNGSTTYQPLFKISSTTTAGGSYQGWQIESIAIIGNL